MIAVYSAFVDHNGSEVKSFQIPEKVLVYVIGKLLYQNNVNFINSFFCIEFCDEEQQIHPKDLVSVTFPRTQAGYSTSSIEICTSADGFNNI